jgi:hypothetical protein
MSLIHPAVLYRGCPVPRKRDVYLKVSLLLILVIYPGAIRFPGEGSYMIKTLARFQRTPGCNQKFSPARNAPLQPLHCLIVILNPIHVHMYNVGVVHKEYCG